MRGGEIRRRCPFGEQARKGVLGGEQNVGKMIGIGVVTKMGPILCTPVAARRVWATKTRP